MALMHCCVLVVSAYFEPLPAGRALAYSRTTLEGVEHEPPPPPQPLPKRVVVCWWEDDLSELANTLGATSHKGSTISIVAAAKPKACTHSPRHAMQDLFSRLRGLHCTWQAE